MKENDVVQRKVKHLKDTPIAHNFSSTESTINFMVHEFGKPVKYKVINDPLNPGAFAPVAAEDWEEVYEGKINWAVGNAVSITLNNGHTFITEDFVGEGWVVTQEAPPPTQTAQERASGMSIE